MTVERIGGASLRSVVGSVKFLRVDPLAGVAPGVVTSPARSLPSVCPPRSARWGPHLLSSPRSPELVPASTAVGQATVTRVSVLNEQR